MEPVVNGLEKDYSDQVEFRRLDVNSQDGKAAFKYYKLLGHPGYVILNSASEVLWVGIGEKSEAELVEQISTNLSTP
jgi:hypothetical protein